MNDEYKDEFKNEYGYETFPNEYGNQYNFTGQTSAMFFDYNQVTFIPWEEEPVPEVQTKRKIVAIHDDFSGPRTKKKVKLGMNEERRRRIVRPNNEEGRKVV